MKNALPEGMEALQHHAYRTWGDLLQDRYTGPFPYRVFLWWWYEAGRPWPFLRCAACKRRLTVLSSCLLGKEELCVPCVQIAEHRAKTARLPNKGIFLAKNGEPEE